MVNRDSSRREREEEEDVIETEEACFNRSSRRWLVSCKVVVGTREQFVQFMACEWTTRDAT